MPSAGSGRERTRWKRPWRREGEGANCESHCTSRLGSRGGRATSRLWASNSAVSSKLLVDDGFSISGGTVVVTVEPNESRCAWCNYRRFGVDTCPECGLSSVDALSRRRRSRCRYIWGGCAFAVAGGVSILAWQCLHDFPKNVPDYVLVRIVPGDLTLWYTSGYTAELEHRRRKGELSKGATRHFVKRIVDSAIANETLMRGRSVYPIDCDPFLVMASERELSMLEGFEIRFSVDGKTLLNCRIPDTNEDPVIEWRDYSAVVYGGSDRVSTVDVVVTVSQQGETIYSTSFSRDYVKSQHVGIDDFRAPFSTLVTSRVVNTGDRLIILLDRRADHRVGIGCIIDICDGNDVVQSRAVWLPSAASVQSSLRLIVPVDVQQLKSEYLRVVVRSDRCMALRDLAASEVWEGVDVIYRQSSQ